MNPKVHAVRLLSVQQTRSPHALAVLVRYRRGCDLCEHESWLVVCPRLACVSPPGSLYAGALAAIDDNDADSAFLTEVLRA